MLVIDTNIWVSYALMPQGQLGSALNGLIGRHLYAFSEATFIELTDVIMRPKFDRFAAPEARGEVLKQIAAGGEWFNPMERVRDCRDPKDNKFLELALAASADGIVTGDQDLLVLSPYRGIPILTLSDAAGKF